MRRSITLFLPLLLGITACGASTGSQAPTNQAGEEEIKVFAAASLSAVGEELISAYRQENPQANITATYAGSSQLVTQMLEGAPADLLITADETTMQKALEEVAELSEASPQTIATNALVLATAPGNPAAIDSIDDLAQEGTMTALCAPQVPCGRLAQQELAQQKLKPANLTEETNVSAVATKLATGQVDAGFIYSTDATSLAKNEDIRIISLPDLDPNAYPLALTSSGQQKEVARDFASWLAQAEEAQEILTSYGFERA